MHINVLELSGGLIFRKNKRIKGEIPCSAMPFSILHDIDFTIERIKKRDMLLIDAFAGNRAYGLELNAEDRDIRGVFVAPASFLLGLDEITYVSDAKNDQVYYELGRFVALLLLNNPTALEMLNMPQDCIRYRHGLFGLLTPELFLSKLCARSYTEYAQAQLKRLQLFHDLQTQKSSIQKKTLGDFCYIDTPDGTVPVREWLKQNGLDQTDCGLKPVMHARDLFHVHIGQKGEYRGMFSNSGLVFSSIPPSERPQAYMVFDNAEFAAYSRELHEQQEWEEKRQREAAQGTPGCDGNAFMNVIRVLTMGVEIAREGIIHTRREDAAELMKIRMGKYSYDHLMALARDKMAEVLQTFRKSSLPNEPDRDRIQKTLLEIRYGFRIAKP